MLTIRIDLFGQPETAQAIALVYQQSFGNEPWNEGYLCPECGKMFALALGVKKCPACLEQSQNVFVVEYWPINKIVSDFYREMEKPESICVVAQDQADGIVGFAWGYRVSANPDIDKHLDAPDLHQSLQGDFFYLDECAVRPDYQGRGIGKLLTGHIFREQKQKQILLRTLDGSRMCNLIKHIGGETIQSISRGRVIMKLIAP